MRWERPEGSIDTDASSVVFRFPPPPRGKAGHRSIFPSWTAAALGLPGRDRVDPMLMRQGDLYYLVSDERSVELTPDGCDYRIRTGWDRRSRTLEDLDSCCVVIGDAVRARAFLAPHVEPDILNDLIPRRETTINVDVGSLVARELDRIGQEAAPEVVGAYAADMDVKGLQERLSEALAEYVGRVVERRPYLTDTVDRKPRLAR